MVAHALLNLVAILVTGSLVPLVTWGTWGTWYVDANAAGCPGSGTKSDPFCAVMLAVNAAVSGDTIHIGAGLYEESLVIDKDLTLIGTEGPAITIVDARGSGRPLTAVTGTSEVCGLTLTGGLPSSGRGGGVLINDSATAATLTLRNTTVSRNYAGGGYYSVGIGGGIFNGNGVLTLIDSTITGNQAYVLRGGSGGASGGGIYNKRGAVTLINSTVSGQAVLGGYGFATGGGIHSEGGSVALSNSTITDNVVGNTFWPGSGSAILNGGSSIMTIDGCTVSRNGETFYGDAIESLSGTLTVTNSIVWGNDRSSAGTTAIGIRGNDVTVNHSNIESGWLGQGSNNIDQDPNFVDEANGNYSLLAGSACIDAGDPSSTPSGLALGGNPRLLDGTLQRTMRIDMGAFEFNNVHLAITGNVAPGGAITVTTTGKAGMDVRLAVGLSPAETLIFPLGSVFFSLTEPTTFHDLGTIPSTTNFVIPTSINAPFDVVAQALALGTPLPGGLRPGNLSNPLSLRIE